MFGYKGIPNGSITPQKTTFKELGKNLFNKATAVSGYYVNQIKGTLAANASHIASDYIPVASNTQYSFVDGTAIRVVYYDSNKTFISGTQNTVSPITTPANCTYVRYSFLNTQLNIQQFELGAVKTIYEAYGYYNTDDIDLAHVSFSKLSKNLFNKSQVTPRYYVSSITGNLSGGEAYNASDYIAVLPSTDYVRSHDFQMAFYDTDKVFISGIALGVIGYFTTPANCAFIRVSVPTVYLNTMQVEAGTEPSSYESYGYKIDTTVYTNDEVLAFLPSEICVAVGRTIELYNKQVCWCGNHSNYHFKWTCEKGKSMKRKWTYTGISGDIGTYDLTLTVLNNNMENVATATTTLKVVTNVIGTAKSILCIGDSLTNEKAWLAELRTLSGNQYTLVGTHGTAPLQHEGRSGFTAANYLGAIEYEAEGVQPFWDASNSRFNWTYYKTTESINPDIVQIYLGANNLQLDPRQNGTDIKSIVNYIRQDDSSIPIYIVFTLYPANQDGIGETIGSSQWELQERRKIYNLMVRLYSLLNTYENLYFVPVSLAHDSEYNFGYVETSVNPRATQKEYLPTERTHPQEQGYLQMADIIFSAIAAH